MLKTVIATVCFVVCSMNLYAQYDTVHYIPASRWKYYNDRHEIVFSTLSTTPVQIEIRRSDGTLIGNTTVVKGAPTRYALSDTPLTDQRNPVNTVLTGEGMTVTATDEVSVNIRNINGDTNDAIIKGNTSLTSKGFLALGTDFHLIYFRDFGAFYGMMAVEDNTVITQNGNPLITLDAGESYVIGGGQSSAALGDHIQASKNITLSASHHAESPGQCADPTADQLIPNTISGKEHIVIRGQGNANLQIEFTTIMATEANTDVYVNGAFNTNLAQPGDWITISNGTTPAEATFIESDRNVLVSQGAGQGCEHGMSIIPPLKCTGSQHIETKDFHNLDYSVFVLSKCNTVSPTLNGTALTGGSAINGSNWTLFEFDNTAVTGEDIILDSETPMHVGILQDGGQFGGFAYFSGFSKNGINLQATSANGDSTIIEGCVPAQYVFTRESFCDETDTILINVTGTATEGVDFNTLPDTLFFTPGTDTLYLDVESYIDNIEEGTEQLEIFIIADKNCDGILDTVASTLYIEDYVAMNLSISPADLEFCVDYHCSQTSEKDSSTIVVANGLSPYLVIWEDGFQEQLNVSPYTSTRVFSEANGNVPFIDTTYTVSVLDICGNEVSTTVTIENNCPVCAPNVITADGDLINDFFVIKNILQHPEATVTIMNRWGNVLLETDNYQNDWSAEGVSEGVYFYKVTVNNELEDWDIHGFFHVVR